MYNSTYELKLLLWEDVLRDVPEYVVVTFVLGPGVVLKVDSHSENASVGPLCNP